METAANESLGALCDDALILSKDHYSEFSLGGMTIRFAVASWHSRAGGTVLLKSRSISFKDHELNNRPASLDIYEHPADNVMALTRYMFKPENTADILFYKLLMPVHDAVSNGRLNQKHIEDLQDELQQCHLTEPSPEDIRILFDELSRGASGLHTQDNETLTRL